MTHLARIVWVATAVLGITGCPTVDLGEPPPVPALCDPGINYYVEVVWPDLIEAGGAPERSCVGESGCHRSADGRTALRFIDVDPGNPGGSHQQNYDVVKRFLNCGTPEASRFFTKPLAGIDAHGGPEPFAPGSEEEMKFLLWFAQ